MYKRLIDIDIHGKHTFFLWGPRQTGKSYLLKTLYPQALHIDLLNTQLFIRYQKDPHLLRQEILALPKIPLVIIDEIQKVPALLDEVHALIESHKVVFVLCGSSARKVKRGHANLLGGRAYRYELHGLVAKELGQDFNLEKILNHGYLPVHYQSSNVSMDLEAYCADYLKEEIAAEGLVRNLPQFSKFLDVVALSDTEPINYANIARDCHVSAITVKSYFEILEDTLMGSFLEPYAKRPKRRAISATKKFYFFNVGVVNYLAKRGWVKPGSELFGKAFENWVYHELKTYLAYKHLNVSLAYWRLSTGVEVDFVLGNMQVAIEVKSSSSINKDHLKGLRELALDHPAVKKRVLVCLETPGRLTDDGIQIVNYANFIELLWSGALI